MRPRRVEVKVPAEDLAQLRATGETLGIANLSDLIRAQLRPLLGRGESLAAALRRLSVEGLDEEIAYLERTIEGVEALVRERGPDSPLRAWLQETLDLTRARLERAKARRAVILKDVTP